MILKGFNHVKHFLSGEKKAPGSRPPRFLAFRSSSSFILATVCIAIFTDILLYGIIVPVIPFALTSRVAVSEESVQTWNAILLACYTIALSIGSPLAGIYADHTSSRRWPLLIGLFALAGATILLCLGRSIVLLILGRILQGISAAIVWSVGLALMADTVPNNIGQAMGYSAIAMSLGLLVSPAIGGAVFSGAGYYAVYYVAFGCILLDIILRLILIEKKVARQWIDGEEESDPEPGTVDAAPTYQPLFDISVVSGKSVSEGQVEGMKDGGRAIAAVPPPATSVATSRKTARHPKLKLLKSRRILAANFGIIIQAGVMFSWDTVLPLFVKSTFHWSSTAAGLIFFCIFIPGFISPVVGWLSDRYGAKWPSFAGFLASIPLLVCLRFVTVDKTDNKVLLGALLALMGVTLIFSNTPLMAEITYAIEAEEAKSPGVFGKKGVYGLGYGLFCTAFALGGSIGSLMSGYVMAGAGWSTLTWALAVWMAGGVVVVASAVGGKPAGGAKTLLRREDNSAESRDKTTGRILKDAADGGMLEGCVAVNRTSDRPV
ncbi:putative MFS-type transporter C18.02 [Cytospora mali]|uniref:MFS-type transporter C18.02 n=1 Tax=Cytospora mali TaxID=578113 RepID=A0A194WE06_CYTMA|nr:putative MFS-type transporter C18.02 [Valsa mali]